MKNKESPTCDEESSSDTTSSSSADETELESANELEGGANDTKLTLDALSEQGSEYARLQEEEANRSVAYWNDEGWNTTLASGPPLFPVLPSLPNLTLEYQSPTYQFFPPPMPIAAMPPPPFFPQMQPPVLGPSTPAVMGPPPSGPPLSPIHIFISPQQHEQPISIPEALPPQLVLLSPVSPMLPVSAPPPPPITFTLPYVANVFDFRIQASFKKQSGAMLNYSYYVPPRTSDDDFFGGQLATYQLKFVQYFIKYQPHYWRMHGVPELFNIELFLGMKMDVLGEFHIVSKLRFCCRTCKTPWTSKKGTIVFIFGFIAGVQQGWIMMKIFGQICMKQDCNDWSFQNPACYPEEIDRAMKKLSEYVGNRCYGIAVKPDNFKECFKSIRKAGILGSVAKESGKGKGGIATPHKKEFCQACINGVCKTQNLYSAISAHQLQVPFTSHVKPCI